MRSYKIQNVQMLGKVGEEKEAWCFPRAFVCIPYSLFNSMALI